MFSKTIGFCAGLCLCISGVFGLPAARAQETAAKATPPPKVLVIDIEIGEPEQSLEIKHRLDQVPGTLRTRILY